MTDPIQPRPDMIGGVPTPPLAMPKLPALFTRRAERLAFLAEGSNLGPYLGFLAALAQVQARLAAALPPLPRSTPTAWRRLAPPGCRPSTGRPRRMTNASAARSTR